MDGSAAIDLPLPATIKATLIGNADTATSATTATTASKLGTNNGSETLPVYFANGVPVSVAAAGSGKKIGIDISGSAASWASDATISGDSNSPVVITADKNINAGAAIKLSTSIGAGKITNAMLAGSIANSKLANSSVTIAGKSVALGGTLAASDLLSGLGLTQVLKFVGTLRTDITAPKTGDVVVEDDGREYVYINSVWQELGDNSRTFKVVQSAVSSPSASGNAVAFIDTISQDTNGKITVTKKTVQDASTSNKGIASFDTNHFTVTSGAVSLKSDIPVNASTATAWKSGVTVSIKGAGSSDTAGASATLTGSEGTLVLTLPSSFTATVSTASTANKTKAALSINGKSFNGSEAIDVGILGIAYGGTGRTDGKAVAWASAIKVTTTDGTNTSTSVDMDGSGAVSIKLPSTIKASLSGNATTATSWANSMTVTISDNSGAHTQANTGFNYASGGKTLKLPATITANIIGNVSGTAASWASDATIKIGASTSKNLNASSTLTFTAAEIGSTVVWDTWD